MSKSTIITTFIIVFTTITILFLHATASSATTTPEDVLIKFQTAWVQHDCQTMYAMLAPQPSGNWYANAEGPNTFVVLNRTNMVAVCEMFSPPNATTDWLYLPSMSANTHVGPSHGMITFASSFTFKGGRGVAADVCTVAYTDMYVANVDVERGLIVEMWEYYDAVAFAKQWSVCNPPPSSSLPSLSLPSSSDDDDDDIVTRFMDGLYYKQCDAMAAVMTDDFIYTDPSGVFNRSMFIDACKDNRYSEQPAPLQRYSINNGATVMINHVFVFGVMDPVNKIPCSVTGKETLAIDLVTTGDAGTTEVKSLQSWFDNDLFINALKTKCNFVYG